MSLSDIDINFEYHTLQDDVARDFLVPLLKEAVIYKRSAGFFSSSVLVEISKGIEGLVRNNGKINLITSPNLSQEDIDAIRSGYKNREEIIKRALIGGLVEPENKYQEEKLNLLANLIADGHLDIKIAVTANDSLYGMYHEKVGIIEDNVGEKVAFSGSLNETENAFTANFETIDVYCNWRGYEDKQRVESKDATFEKIWNGRHNNIKTLEFKELTDQLIKKYKTSDVDYSKLKDLDEKEPTFVTPSPFFKVPNEVKFYDYQKEAIKKWEENSFRGIYDMATGTGKTYTALGSICRLSNYLNNKLAVVIVAPYQHLVEQWIEDIRRFGVEPIVAYSKNQSWKEYLSVLVDAYNAGKVNSFCVLATNATFSSKYFQSLIVKIRINLCFVADEAHNIGAEKISQKLPENAKYRLALSATIERNEDIEGTQKIYEYFENTCITFGIREAIQHNFLTPYYYHPVLVFLDDFELEEYQDVTRQILNCMHKGKNNFKNNKHLEYLLIKRAKIVAGCRQKIDKIVEIMRPYKDNNNMLVYCGATRYDISEKDISDDSDIRQIDEVTQRLSSELDMKVRKFTASENIDDRIEIKELFTSQKIQVITAIKCLDEGVNIPSIERAFILASSSNPREYIQRRGRILRKFKGKKIADIFDFITLPRYLDTIKYRNEDEIKYDKYLVAHEIDRMKYFSEDSENSSESERLILHIENSYGPIY